jgi:hypothetical protein
MAVTIRSMVFWIVMLPLPLHILLILPPASVGFLLGLLSDLEDEGRCTGMFDSL